MAANKGKLILLLGLACAGSAVAQESKPTVRHHRVGEDFGGAAVVRAERALDQKDYVTAESALKQALEHDADNYRAWYDLGVVYNATSRSADAIAAYRKSIAAFPKLFEANFNLGVLLARAGDPEAEKYFRAATELAPTDNRDQNLARAWRALAQWLEPKDAKQALAAYRRAAALQPKDPTDCLSAAMVAEKLGDPAVAEQEYKVAAERDANSAEAIAGLANLYLKAKRLPEAEAALRRYVAIDPENANAHLQLGRVLAAEDKSDAAQAEFESALRLAPDNPKAQRELALLYADNKEYAKAEPLFRAALEKQPDDAESHHRLGKALLQQKKFDQAQKELLAAIKLKPDYGIAYGDLAFAASENKDYVLVIKALDARAKFLPELAETLFLRATAYDHLRAAKQAAAAYREFLAVANGKYPDQEWQARHRLIAIEPKK
jgi:tetratricopeptide (TPR) repeat protein